MATSGVRIFNESFGELIEDAFYLIGKGIEVEQLATADRNFAARMLNRMILAWQAQDLHLWLRTEAILFVQQNQYIYDFTDATHGDHCTYADDYVETQLNADMLANSTQLTVLSTTGMVANQYIGIILDSNETYWTTIVSVDSATLVTITAAQGSGTAVVASTNNYLHTYTTKITRPLRILQARRYTYSSAQDLLIGRNGESMAREDYFMLSNKSSPGQITQYYYDPQLGTGVLYVWANPSDSLSAVKFTYLDPIEVFTTTTDTPDLPNEWLLPIVYNLAVLLAPAYGKGAKIAELKEIATEQLRVLLCFDTEKSNLTLSRSKY